MGTRQQGHRTLHLESTCSSLSRSHLYSRYLSNSIGDCIAHVLASVEHRNPTLSRILFHFTAIILKVSVSPNVQVVKCQGQGVKAVSVQLRGYLITPLLSERTCPISQARSFGIIVISPRDPFLVRHRKGLFRTQGCDS